MNAFERFNSPRDEFELEDYQDSAYYNLLIQLPPELARMHIHTIETSGFDDTQATEHLTNVLKERKEAVTTTVISDAEFREVLGGNERSFFEQIETSVYRSADIGAGQTARVKRFTTSSETSDTQIPLAIKYLITPKTTTLHASAEHNILKEVEKIRTIEELERKAHVERVRVPHPYFHHQTKGIECYGMELVDGVTLEDIVKETAPKEVCEKILNSLSNTSEKEILEEVKKFFAQMHTYCLHNDIKPLNIMVSVTGTIYIIDFGESVLIDSIPEEGRDALDDTKERELAVAMSTVQAFLRHLSHYKNK